MRAHKRVALYARVSTRNGQDPEVQMQALRDVAARAEWTIVETFIDHGISGAKGRKERPGLDTMLKGVVQRRFNLVAVWSTDRLGRSLTDLIAILKDLQAADCDLYIHTQALDTSTPSGKALFQMLGVFAEFESEIIKERVRAGLAKARAESEQERRKKKKKAFGRPRFELKHPEEAAEIIRRGDAGESQRSISRTLKIPASTVRNVLLTGKGSRGE
jgi:DNA invertase Pin-like site-specific DNA recombinase